MQRLRSWAQVINPAGRTVLVLAVLAGVLAAVLEWREVSVLAFAATLLMLLALPWLIGRTRVQVRLDLDPHRVAAGGTVAGSVEVRNAHERRMLPTLVEVPVGSTVHRYALNSLAPGETQTVNFTIRTERRGVINVGPVLTRRGDPLGLMSRDLVWTDRAEVLVRPPMAPLEALGAGLLRDLEGVTTDTISNSDLAFHALREYVPGDDLRHVHWRSSAKAMAAGGENQLLVRQYLDTRRSHACVVVDDQLGSYAGADEYELAMSVAASILVRAVIDGFDASFVSGGRGTSDSDGNRVLDELCRAEPGRVGLIAAGREAFRLAPDVSLLFLISGPGTDLVEFQRAGVVFGPEVQRYAVVIDPRTRPKVTDAAGLPVLQVPALTDLAPVLTWSVR
ncbi:DUF58 domain-containing protein [Nocardioides limicola]|uniref:DUF58 domain-containing protein n=1 Tax=Nocardioides limicola TaxID=2803368 RepID=UPI00193C1298|nr:DUF58 domain-containing protein [Nocardioides sp. DJM-14]